MPAGTPDEWLYTDWLLIANALREAQHKDCQCYECDTIEALLGDIAYYWDLDEPEFAELVE